MKALRSVAVVGIMVLCVSLIGLWSNKKRSHDGDADTSSEWMGVTVANAKEKAIGSPYDADIKPLSTAECGQCHYSVFQGIKKKGGLHQIDCVRCHKEYHVYNPRKQNYDDIMPQCIWCHQDASGGPFHGDVEGLTACLTCHADPHQPLTIPMGELFEKCAACHREQGKEVQDYPSLHTEVACSDCHAEKHGHIPECDMCHESHSPAVEMSSQDCMSCHPVHRPTQMNYASDTNSLICAGCHGDVYKMLQDKVTKHTAVACAECHPRHAEALSCKDCHGEPHPASMNATNCEECHGIAHDLLM
jgi:predicted CXXCH cytochrome family protein